jgi:hypothetical protein
MDTKFASSYWSHLQVEAAPLEVKLAGAWMRTNDRVTLFGYAAVTPQRFAFETGLAPEWLGRAIEALSEWFIRAPRGYFIPGYIGEQFGRGQSLLANNACKGLVRTLKALHDADVFALVVRFYPEVEVAFKVAGFDKPSPSPSEGLQIGEERLGEERNGAERVGGAGGRVEPEPKSARPKKPKPPGARLPEEQPEPTRSRMLALNAIFRRQPGTAWSSADVRALDESGLLSVDEFDFVEACETVRGFYLAKIPREMEHRFWRRTTLQTLLNNWAGELDKARAWNRDRDDGVTKV